MNDRGSSDKIMRIASQYASIDKESDVDAIRLYFRVEAVNERLQQASRRLVASILPGFKGWQGAILRALYLAPGHQLSAPELHNETLVSATEVGSQLDELEKDGYVTRMTGPGTENATLVALTPEGEAICHKLLPARARFMSNLGRGFSADEKGRLNELLERLEKKAEEFAP